ncbi:MAG: hypothetical protein KME17_23275 [Cyanosarcina radialis HA8281-LM2]|jgi:hypothetical protein|nr:hypothetical protein [Cyanosarcina radialis HA8281-LM2]
MDLEIVFNELSIEIFAQDIPTAKQWMSEFINTILAIKLPPGGKRKLRTKNDFNYLLLAPSYTVVQWRNDPNVDLETRRFLRTLQDRNNSPIPDIIDLAIEVNYHGKQAIGLYYASILKSLAISFKSSSQWNCSLIELEITEIDDDEQIITRTEIVIHASCINHIEEHKETIRDRVKFKIDDGIDLWKCKEELFPSLEFCENVCKQLQSIGRGELILQQIIKKLSELEEACKSWIDGAFNLDNLASKASPESETRLQQFREQLTFVCPDGEKRIFTLHVRITGAGAWRLHFCTELGPGKIIIGYVGLKIQ